MQDGKRRNSRMAGSAGLDGHFVARGIGQTDPGVRQSEHGAYAAA